VFFADQFEEAIVGEVFDQVGCALRRIGSTTVMATAAAGPGRLR
jgi:hypothetical protein